MKIKLTACLLVLLFFSACKDDDTFGDYVGTWIGTDIEIEDCPVFTDDDFFSVECNDNTCYKLVLEADASYSFQMGLDVENGTWAANGVNLSFCYDEEGEETCQSYVGLLTNSGLRLSSFSETDSCTTSYIMERQVEADTTTMGS